MKLNRIKFLFLTGILALLFCFSGKAQDNTTPKKESKEESVSSIEATVDYTGDSGFYGVYNNLVKQPTLGSTVAYYGKKGIFLLANGYVIGNSNPTLSKSTEELDLAAGWNFFFYGDAITLAPNFAHFFYSNGSTTAKSMFTNEFGLSASGDFNWFRPAATFDYLFGTSKSANLNLTIAFHLEANDMLAKDNIFEFEPSAGANYGDNSFYYRLSNLNFKSISSLRAQYGDKITIKELLTLSVVKNSPKIENQLRKLSQNATLGEIFSYTPSNQINSVEFIFPVKYIIKNLTINSALNISLPMNIPDFITSQTHVFLTAGISYSFDL